MSLCKNIQKYVKFLMYWITLLNDAIYTAKIYIDLPNHILLGRDVGDCFLSPGFEFGSGNLQEMFPIFDIKYL